MMDTGTQEQSGKRPWTAEPTEKVFEIFIKTTPERVWEAITDPELRRKYNFGASAGSEWTSGSRYELAAGDMPVEKVNPFESTTPSRSWSESIAAKCGRFRSSRSMISVSCVSCTTCTLGGN